MKRALVCAAIMLVAWAPRAWAQVFPITLLVEWDANDPSDVVTGYFVAQDSDPAIAVDVSSCIPRTAGGPSICRQVVQVKTPGAHLFSVRAANQWAVSEPETASVTVQLPSPVKQIRITKTK